MIKIDSKGGAERKDGESMNPVVKRHLELERLCKMRLEMKKSWKGF
jgi:hypothetical protein